MKGQAEKITPRVPVGNPMPSKPLSQYSVAPKSLAGKKIGLLTTDRVDAALYNSLVDLANQEQATLEVIAPKVGPIKTSKGKEISPQHFLAGAPSVLFDCVVVAPALEHVEALAREAAAIDWIRDAFSHLKVIGFNQASVLMFEKSSVAIDADEGMVDLDHDGLQAFLEIAKKHRIWEREPTLRS